MPPSRVNSTSPAWVASTTASCFGLCLTRLVASKNSNVAITPENSATLRDWRICPEEGSPWVSSAYAEHSSQSIGSMNR